jgi:hypothetical protein
MIHSTTRGRAVGGAARQRDRRIDGFRDQRCCFRDPVGGETAILHFPESSVMITRPARGPAIINREG